MVSDSFLVLLSVKQYLRGAVIHLNPTPFLRVAVVERQLPAAFPLRRGEPQSQQMPARRWWWVVLVLRSSMKKVLVGHKLDVSDFEFHV